MKRAATSCAWFAFLPTLALFAFSLAPGVGTWDTAEMQVTTWILGVPHAFGFPAFVILGWIFAHLEPFGNPAWRTGLFSAVAMAGACATLALFLREFAIPRVAAVFGAYVFAVGEVTWTRGSRTEVQALAVFWIGLALLCAVRWLRTREPRDAAVAAAAWGFGLATHLVTIFLGPGLLCVALLGRRALTPRRALAVLAAAVAPVLLYAYVPLRSAYLFAVRRDPTLALGLPPGRPFWDTNHAAGGLASYLDAAPQQIGGGVAGAFAPDRWAPVAQTYGAALLHEFGWIGVVAGLLGLAFAFRERPLLWAALVAGVTLTIPFILNFPESDQDRYYLGSFWLFSAAIAIGTYRVISAAVRRPRAGAAGSGIALAALALSLGIANDTILQQRNDVSGQAFVDRVVAVTPPHAIVVSEWTYVTSLAYAAYATHELGDRIVVSGWPTDYADHYRAWLASRPVVVHAYAPPLVLPPGYGVTSEALDVSTNLYELRLSPRVSSR